MMRLACDRVINGKLILSTPLSFYERMGYRCVSDLCDAGHSLMIVPRSIAKEGYMDVDKDDYTEEGYFKKTQETQLVIIEDKWLDDYRVRIYKE